MWLSLRHGALGVADVRTSCKLIPRTRNFFATQHGGQMKFLKEVPTPIIAELVLDKLLNGRDLIIACGPAELIATKVLVTRTFAYLRGRGGPNRAQVTTIAYSHDVWYGT